MKTALVKIDLATATLGKSAKKVFELVDGGTVSENGFLWIFNVACNPRSRARQLRIWWPELIARTQGDAAKYSHCKIEQVIADILPPSRSTFQAGEVDQLFQIRPNTRIDYGMELAAVMKAGRNSYSRATLAAFLKRRWLGAVTQKGKSPA
jgi:hypothetical protein